MLKKRIGYVLSEIAIVIIGILIAFSIDRCAENRKDSALREQYLKSLLIDLEAEKEELQQNILAFREKQAIIQQVYPYLNGKQEGRDTIVRKIFQLPRIVHFNGHEITYKTLVNTGDIRLIGDFELIKHIEQHYMQHESLQLDYNRQNGINDKYFGSFMIYNFDAQAVMQGDFSFMEDPLLISIINSLQGTYQIAIDASQNAIERVEVLEERIRKVLES